MKPNTTQRLFEIDFSDTPSDARRNIARYLQVVVRGSRLGRGEEVEAGEYERLPEEDRGGVEYMKRRSDGGEVAVPEENYLRLPEDRRGPIRYFRRERPRLAELEIRAEGEDLARRLLDRGGSVAIQPDFETRPNNMLDGDISTYLSLYYTIRPGLDVLAPNIVTDLGAFFWINSLQIIMNLRGSSHSFTFGDFQLDFSDGSPAGRRQPRMGHGQTHRAGAGGQRQGDRRSRSRFALIPGTCRTAFVRSARAGSILPAGVREGRRTTR